MAFNRNFSICIIFAFLTAMPFCHAQQVSDENSLRNAIKQYDIKKANKGETALSITDTIKADILAELVLLNYIEKPDTALKDAEQLSILSKKIGYSWGIAQSYEMQGNIYEFRRDYDKAIHFFGRAFTIYDKLGKLNAIDMLNNIGVAYSKKGIYSEALQYLLRALDMSRSANDVQGLISSYNNIGLIYNDQKKHDEALNYYLKCLSLQLKHGGQLMISQTYSNIGQIYIINKKYTEALRYFELGLAAAFKEGNNESKANNYSSLGNLYIEKGDMDTALRYHESALGLRKKIDDNLGMISSYMAFGKIYHKKGDNAAALQYANRALALVKTAGELDWITQCYKLLAEVTAALGNHKEAYHNLELYKKYSDSLFNAENEKKLVQQQMNFDFKVIQEKKDRQAAAEVQRQKNIRHITIAALILLGLSAVFILVWRHRKASRAKQKLHDEEITIKELEAQALKVENENIQLKNDLMAVEKEIEHKQNEKLQENLEFNRRELASATLYLFQKNQKLTELKTEIDTLKTGSITTESLDKIKAKIQENLYLDADWDKFKLHFEQVHPNFFKELDEKHPGLTNYEVRLYAYLHMKLSTKEIAGLLNITPASVIKAKARLNKKLNRGE